VRSRSKKVQLPGYCTSTSLLTHQAMRRRWESCDEELRADIRLRARWLSPDYLGVVVGEGPEAISLAPMWALADARLGDAEVEL
jgi:hypothetical protein